MPLDPPAAWTTPRTWWTLIPPSANPTAEPAMYSRQHAGAGLTDEPDRLLPVRLQVGDPRPQRAGVVLAQRLDVADLEAGSLHRQDGVADVDELTVGEHVAADERRAPQSRPADGTDRVVEQPALGPQGVVEDPVVRLQVRLPDVLGHPDRGDHVELFAGQLAVVLEADLHPVADAGIGDPLAGELGLRAADRDAHHAGVVMGRGVDRHRAPAAPDVEQTRAGLLGQAELATDQLVLGRLRLGQVHLLVGEPGARVRHRRPEHEAVEVVAHVVVVADGLGVPAPRVAPTVEARLQAAAAGVAVRRDRAGGRR